MLVNHVDVLPPFAFRHRSGGSGGDVIGVDMDVARIMAKVRRPQKAFFYFEKVVISLYLRR